MLHSITPVARRYHHVTVLLFCWHSFMSTSSAGLYFVSMNYGVHALMYFCE